MIQKNIQPIETIGKVIKYFCGGRWHYPHLADELNWSKNVHDGAISPNGIITKYEILNYPKSQFKKANFLTCFPAMTPQNF